MIALLAILSVTGRDADDLVAKAPDFNLDRATKDVNILSRHRHPRGSPEHDQVLEYLVAELRSAGLEVRVQEASVCTVVAFAQNCGRVRNVVGQLPGTGGGDVALFSAHYDSVPASYGASDNGAGVASLLEVARELRKAPAGRNDVVILFTDGEEDGLLGAAAFVRDDPLAKRVRAFVNFEARGTHGASAMYASTAASAPVLRAFSASAVRPASDSFLALLANVVPNGADSMVYEHAGLSGLSFAFVDGLENYHTGRDDAAHLARGSLAHHGVQAMALARSLRDADLAAHASEPNPTHFDVLGRWSVSYPAWLARLLALAAVAAVIATIGRRPGALRRLLLGLALLAGACLCAVVLGLAVTATLGGESIETIVLHGASLSLGITIASVSVLAALARWDVKRPWGSAWLDGSALLFALVTALLGIAAPAASFAFAFPALALALQSRIRLGVGWWILAAVPLYVFGRLAAITAIMMGAIAPALPVSFAVLAVGALAWRGLTVRIPGSLLAITFTGGLALATIPLHMQTIAHDPGFGTMPSTLSASTATAEPPPRVTVASRTTVAGRSRVTLRIQPARRGAQIEVRTNSGTQGDLATFDGAPPTVLSRFSPEMDRRLLRLLFPLLAPDSLRLNLLAPSPEGEDLTLDIDPGARVQVTECLSRTGIASCATTALADPL